MEHTTTIIRNGKKMSQNEIKETLLNNKKVNISDIYKLKETLQQKFDIDFIKIDEGTKKESEIVKITREDFSTFCFPVAKIEKIRINRYTNNIIYVEFGDTTITFDLTNSIFHISIL